MTGMPITMINSYKQDLVTLDKYVLTTFIISPMTSLIPCLCNTTFQTEKDNSNTYR